MTMKMGMCSHVWFVAEPIPGIWANNKFGACWPYRCWLRKEDFMKAFVGWIRSSPSLLGVVAAVGLVALIGGIYFGSDNAFGTVLLSAFWAAIIIWWAIAFVQGQGRTILGRSFKFSLWLHGPAFLIAIAILLYKIFSDR